MLKFKNKSAAMPTCCPRSGAGGGASQGPGDSGQLSSHLKIKIKKQKGAGAITLGVHWGLLLVLKKKGRRGGGRGGGKKGKETLPV